MGKYYNIDKYCEVMHDAYEKAAVGLVGRLIRRAVSRGRKYRKPIGDYARAVSALLDYRDKEYYG